MLSVDCNATTSKTLRNMMRAFLALSVLLAMILIACKPIQKSLSVEPVKSPTSIPPQTPTETTVPIGINIEIHSDEIHQIVGHIGSGNFIHLFGGKTSATDPVSQMNLDVFQPRYARVAIELEEWEPENDNSDPALINQDAFLDDQHNRATFELMKLLKERGVDITASIWRVPDWLVENPDDDSPRIIARAMYPEAIESIVAWLIHAKESYGVDVDYVSFNEANLGVTVLLSSEDAIEMVRQGGKRFEELGLRTKWLLGDCSSIKGCLDYVEPIWAAQDIRPYLGPLAYHNWDGTSVSDATIQALGDWADKQGLEARCTEGGWDAQLWQRAKEFPGWTNALELAVSYSRTLKMGHAIAFYYWEMMGQDYPLNDGENPYPSMLILRQMDEAFPPGTQILGTSANKSAVVWVAGLTPAGDFSMQFISSTVSEKARLSGIPEGSYELLVSDRDEIGKLVQTFEITDGSLVIDIPGFSVVLIKTHH